MPCIHGIYEEYGEHCELCKKELMGKKESLSNNLLCCPFCNWKAIMCLTCGARGPISKDGLEANRLWNTRAI